MIFGHIISTVVFTSLIQQQYYRQEFDHEYMIDITDIITI